MSAVLGLLARLWCLGLWRVVVDISRRLWVVVVGFLGLMCKIVGLAIIGILVVTIIRPGIVVGLAVAWVGGVSRTRVCLVLWGLGRLLVALLVASRSRIMIIDMVTLVSRNLSWSNLV